MSWRWLPWAAVALAVVASLAHIIARERRQADPRVRTVRILHWQLELGYREALQRALDDYNRRQAELLASGRQDYRIEAVQVPVSERLFAQVLTVHLTAGTGPDIFTQSGMVDQPRHCLDLGPWLRRPNPYHAPEFLAGAELDPQLAAALPTMAWQDTCLDGMAGGYDPELQTQYGVPLSFTIGGRLAGNLDLLAELTGRAEIPRTLGELVRLSEAARELRARRGRSVWPIAASRYNHWYFVAELPALLLQPWQERLDADGDGDVTHSEGWAGLAAGRAAWRDPIFLQYLDAVQAAASAFAPGFASRERDAGLQLFLDGQAALYFCASWDAGTVRRLSQGRFRIGFAPLPVPGPGEPWSEPPRAPLCEANIVAGGNYQVNRHGRVAEAIDVLHWLTSVPVNQRFNRDADWIPVAVGSRPAEHLAAFAPRLDGEPPAWSPTHPWGGRWSGQVGLALQGEIAGLASGERTREQVLERIEALWRDPRYGMAALAANDVLIARDQARHLERVLAVPQALGLATGQPLPAERVGELLWGLLPLHHGARARWLYRQAGFDPEVPP